jgi:hypothetical protein
MEDTQDKVRRNVITLSTLIILFWFLDLKLSTTLTLLGTVQLENVSPFKLWLCITAILVYMSLRYRFDGKTNIQIREIEPEVLGFQRMFLQPRLVQSVTDLIIIKRHPQVTSAIQLSDHPTNVSATRLETLLTDDIPKQSKIKATLLEPSIAKRSGAVQFSGVLIQEGDGLKSDHLNCIYQTPVSTHLHMLGRTAVRLICYSKSSVDVLAPFVVAYLALLICLSRLAQLW